ncbi:hypothetical protein WMY93_033043 [Mugilogobius chulae]|uniref:Uncharacterized protein n=1 Tax=Mugilogobius chulae TaxID=88201 RepID=A0AAW0MLT2_9GOBI
MLQHKEVYTVAAGDQLGEMLAEMKCRAIATFSPFSTLCVCFVSAHDTGLVMLQVAMGGEVISSSVVFEYKARDLPALPSSQHDWLSLDDTQFRMSILERLEQMEQRMAEISNPNQSSESTGPKGGGAEGGATEQSWKSQVHVSSS